MSGHATLRTLALSSLILLTATAATAQTPILTGGPPAESFVGEQFCFGTQLTNTGAPGYGPYVRLIVPDGFEFGSASAFGGADITFGGTFPAAPGNQLSDPLTGDTVTGPEGAELWIIRPRIGSVTTGQPPIDIDICIDIDVSATVGLPYDVTLQPAYLFGDTPTGVNGPLYGTADTSQVTPTVITFEKNNTALEGSERTTGPTWPVTFTLTANIANGQTVTNLDFIDTLSADMQFVGPVTITGGNGCSTTTTPSTVTPGGTLRVQCTSALGTTGNAEVTVSYPAYVVDTLVHDQCVTETETNTATLDAEYLAASLAQLIDTSDVVAKHLAIQKGAGATTPVPGDTITYTVDIQVSDYIDADNLVLVDVLPDGVTFVGLTSLVFGGTDYTASIAPCVAFPAAGNCVYRDDFPNAGETSLTFDVSSAVGAVLARGTGGQLVYTATIDQLYEGTNGPVDDEVRAADVLANTIDSTYDVLDPTPLVTGCTEGSGASVTIEPVSLSKSIHPDFDQAEYVPTDEIVFLLTMQIPSGDTKSVVIEDFFPLPVFDVSTVTTTWGGYWDGTGAPAQPSSDVGLGPDTSADLQGIPAGDVTITTDAATNSIRVEFASDIIDAVSIGRTLQVYVRLAVESDPFADDLDLVNQYRGTYSDTPGNTISDLTPLPIRVRAPDLELTKGIAATSGDGTLDGLIEDPENRNLIDADAGDTVTYRITLENTGGAPAYDVTVTDPPPSDLTGCGAPVISDAVGGPLTATGDLTTGLVLDSAIPGGFIEATHAVSVVGGGNPTTGSILEYTVNLLNNWDELPNASFTIDVPTGTTYVGGTLSSTLGTANDSGAPTLSVSLGTMAWGDAATITYRVTITAGAGSVLDSQGSFSGNGVATELTDDDNDDLNGDRPLRLTVGDPLGPQAVAPTFVSNRVQIDTTCTIADSVEIEGSFDNTAEATWAAESGNSNLFDPVEDLASVSIDDTGISKSVVGAPTPTIGETFSYTVTVTVPEGTSSNATLVDTLDNGLAFVDCTSIVASGDLSGVPTTCNPGTGAGSYPQISNAGRTVTFDLGDVVNPGNNGGDETITFTYEVVVLNVAGNVRGTPLNNSATWTWDGGSNGDSATNVTVIEPALEVIKATIGTNGNGTLTGSSGPPDDRNLTGADAGDTVNLQIVFRHTGASNATAYDVTLTDTLPAGLTLASAPVCTPAGAAAPTTCAVAGNGVSVTYVGANPFPVGATLTVTFDATIDGSVYPTEVLTNTATLDWTSLPGPVTDVSTYAGDAENDERTAPDYQDSDPATVTIANPVPEKTVDSTSEAHTTDVGGTTAGAIGEIVRFRLVAQIPEGFSRNLQLRDQLPNGLQLLDDGTALVAFLSDGGISSGGSDYPLDPAAISCDGVGPNPDLLFSGADPTLIEPECPLPDVNLSEAIDTTDDDTYGNGSDFSVKLGDVTNADSDSNAEYVIVELNVIVTNVSGNQAINNSTGANQNQTRTNDFLVLVDDDNDGTPTQKGDDSTNAQVRIVEPYVTVTKAVTVVPIDAGDPVQYTLTIDCDNHGVDAVDAFDLVVVDTLPGSLTGVSASITSQSGATNAGVTTVGNLVTLTADRLNLDGQIVVTINATTVATTEPAQVIANTANLTYTSLPNDGTPDGTGGNDTGSTAAAGDERSGDSGLDDYAGSSTVSNTLSSPQIDKLDLPAPAEYTIGEELTYDILVTVPEGNTDNLVVYDDLPAGLIYVSHSVITQTGVPDSQLTASFDGTVTTTPTLTQPGDDVRLAFGTVTANPTGGGGTSANQFQIRLTVRVANILSNQDGTTLTNQVRLEYDNAAGNPASFDDPTDPQLTVIEPVLRLDKQVSSLPSPVDAGETVEYTIVIDHDPAFTSSADAFDLVFTDTIPAAFDAATIAVSVAASGIPAPTFDLTGADITVPATGTFDLPEGASVTITVTADIALTVFPNQQVDNTGRVVWSSLDGTPTGERTSADTTPNEVSELDGGSLDDYELESTATFNVDNANATKALVESNLADTTNPDLTIGEVGTYAIRVTLPDGTTPSLEVVDDVPIGMSAQTTGVSIVTTVAGSFGLLTEDFSGTFNPADPAIVAPGASGDDVTVTWSNSISVPADGSTANNSFLVVVEALMLDEAANVGYGGPPTQTELDNVGSITIGTNPAIPTNTVTTPVVEPLLTIVKSIVADPAEGGATVTVSLDVTNTGNSTAYDVIIEDPIPTAIFSNILPVATPTGAFGINPAPPNNVVTYTGCTIQVGAPVVFQFSAQISTAVENGDFFDNVATVTQATTLPAGHPNEGNERDEPDVNDTYRLDFITPDLELDKDDGGVTAQPSDTVAYTITVTNTGGADATGVEITDTVPVNTTFNAGASTAGWSCSGTGPGSVCTFAVAGTLAASGGSTSVTFALDIDDPLPDGITEVTNSASTTDDGTHGTDPTPGNNSDSDTTPIDAFPDLTVSKDDGGVTVAAGDTITYTISYDNLGDQDATGVVLTETVPANTTSGTNPGWVVATTVNPCNSQPAGTTCELAVGAVDVSDPPGSASFVVVVDDPLPASVDQIDNTISIADDGANGADSDPGNNDGSDSTPLDAAPDLSVSKDDGIASAQAGDTVTYTITYANSGTQDATGVVLTETVPANTTSGTNPGWVVATTVIPCNGQSAGTVCELSIGALAAGDPPATASFEVVVGSPLPSGVTLTTNTVTIEDDTLNGPDENPGDETGSHDTPLIANPDLSVTKDDGQATASPGQTLTYTLTYDNIGDQDATGVVLTETVPDDTTSGSNPGWEVGSVGSGVPCDSQPAGTVCVRSIGAVDVSDPAGTASFVVVVDDPLGAGVVQIDNTASIADDGNNGTDPLGNNSDDDVDPISGAMTSVEADKTATLLNDADGSGNPSPGDTLLYEVVITNTGNQDANGGVTFTDNITDPNLSLVPFTVTTSQGTVTSGNSGGDVNVGVLIGTISGGGGTVTITYQVLIADPVPASASQVVNQGTVSGSNFTAEPTNDPTTAPDDDPTVVPITAAPLIESYKSDALLNDVGDPGPSPGDTLRYTVTVSNSGNQEAAAVLFRDLITDANLTLVDGSVTTSQGSVTTGNGGSDTTVEVDIGSLAVGTTVTITFDVVIASSVPAGINQVQNQGLVTSGSGGNFPDEDTDDPDTGSDDDPTVTPITAAPVIEADKSDILFDDADSSGDISPGDTLAYTVTITNTGTQDANGGMTFSDPISDPNLSLEVGSVITDVGGVTTGNSGGDTTVVVALGTLPAGGTATITYRAVIANPLPPGVSQVQNQGTVSGSNFTNEPTNDPDTGPDDDPTVTPVTAAPVIEVEKSDTLFDDVDGSGDTSPGDVLTYTVEITNSGNADAGSVIYTDLLSDPNLTLVAGSVATNPAGLTVTSGNGGGDTQVVVDVGVLQGSGTTVTITYRATISSPVPAGTAQVANQGITTGSNFTSEPSDDPDTVDPDDDTETPITSAPDVEVSKDDSLFVDNDGDTVVSPGDVLLYTITITNSGNANASSVQYVDFLTDPYLTLVVGSVSAPPGSTIVAGNTAGDTQVNVNVGTLGGLGGSATITYQATISNPLPAGVSQVANHGLVTGSNFPNEPSDDPDSPAEDDDDTETPVTADPLIEVSKRDFLIVDADSNSVPSPGDTLEYVLEITNTGNADAGDVLLTDILTDPNLSLVVGSVMTSAGTVTSGNTAGDSNVSVDIGTIPGLTGTVTVSFRVLIADPVPAGTSEVFNQATVTGSNFTGEDSDDPDTAADDDRTETPLTAEPILEATKDDALLIDADGDTLPSPGDTLSYTITITNSGNENAAGVQFEDLIADPNLGLVVGSVITSGGTVITGNTGGDTTVLVDVGTIPGSGGSVSISFSVLIADPVPAGTSEVGNQGLVTSTNHPDEPTDDPDTPTDDDETDTPITAAPVIELFKSDTLLLDADTSGDVSAGDTLLYTLEITNSGNQNASGLTVTDTLLDANLSLVVGTVNGPPGSTVVTGNTAGDTTIEVLIGTLTGGGTTATITFEAQIADPMSAGTTVVANQAVASGTNFPDEPSDDPDAAPEDDPTEVAVTADPLIEASKTDQLVVDADGDGVPSPGDTLLYSVTITNSGNADAANIGFSDTPDANTTLVAGSVSASQGTITSGNAGVPPVTVDVGTIPGRGGSATITFRVTINDPFPGGVATVANQGLVTGDDFTDEPTDDPDSPPNDDPTETPVTIDPQLEVWKSDLLVDDADGSGGPSAGDELLYTITVRNAGNGGATGVTLTDTPDANTTLVPGSVSTSLGTVTGGNAGVPPVTVDIGSIPGGGTDVTITFRVTINDPLPAGTLQVANQALVSSNELPTEPSDDPETPSEDDPTITPLGTTPLLEAAKRDSLLIDADLDGFASPGDTLRYEVVLTNLGSGDATGVSFTDLITDPNLSLVSGSVTTTLGTVTTGNGGGDTTVAIDLGTVPGGTSVTITFEVLIADPLTSRAPQVANQGVVSSNELPDEPTDDPDTPDEDDPTETPLGGEPLLEASKADFLLIDADGDGEVSAGDTLTYEVTIRNSSDVDATSVVFTDLIDDPNLTLVVGSVQTTDGTVITGNGAGDANVEVDIGTVPGLGAVTIGFEVLISDPVIAGTTQVANQGVVSADDIPTEPTDDPDTAQDDDETITPLGGQPLIEADKVDSLLVDADIDGVPSAGDNLRYTVTITNLGSVAADGLVFADPVADSNLALLAGSVTTTYGTVTTGNGGGDSTVEVAIGTLQPGSTVTITFDVVIADPLPGGVTQVVNQGVVTGDNTTSEPTDDPDTTADDDPTVTPLGSDPQIEVEKADALFDDADGDGFASDGDTLLYTVTISNLGGGPADDVVLTDIISDPYLDLVVGSVQATQGTVVLGNGGGDTSVEVDLGRIVAGGSEVVTFEVLIVGPIPMGVTQVANQALVAGSNFTTEPSDDPDTAPDDDETVTPLGSRPQLEVDKTDFLLVDADGDTVPSPGDTLELVLQLSNPGTAELTGVTLTDLLTDVNLSLIAGTVQTTQGTIVSGNGGGDTTVVVDLGTIPAGGVATVSFQAAIADPVPVGTTLVANQALVTSTDLPDEPSDDPDTPDDDDPTEVPVTSAPVVDAFKTDLLLIDADGDSVPSPGDTLEYVVTIINTGNANAANLVFTDLITDSNLSLVVGSVQTSQGSVVTGNTPGDTTVEVAVGTLAGAGGSATVTFQVTIAAPLPAGTTTVDNQGMVTGTDIPTEPTDDPDTADDDDPTDTPVTAEPALDATKTDILSVDADGSSSPSPGDTLTYTVTITNSGNQNATDVVFTDPIADLNLTLVAGTVATSAGTVITGNSAGDSTVEITVGTLAGGGGAVTITFDVTVADPVPAGTMQVGNQGLVTSTNHPDEPSDDPDTPDDDDPTDTPITAEPLLAATKTVQLLLDADANGVASPGDTLEYGIVIRNDGNEAASGVVFDDTPGTHTTLVAGSVQTSTGSVVLGNTAGDSAVQVDVGTIPGGSQVSITFQVTIDTPLPAGVTQVTNQGVVGSDGVPDIPTDDPDEPGDDNPTDTPVEAAPDLVLTKDDGLASIIPPAQTTYTITVENVGTQDAVGVSISDTLPAGTTYLSASDGGSEGPIGTVTWPLVDLAAGTSLTRTVTIDVPVQPLSVTEIVNTAVAQDDGSNGDDPTPDNNTDDDVDPIGGVASIDVIKSVSAPSHGDSYLPGQLVTWTIVVSNTGTAPGVGLTMTDQIPVLTAYFAESTTLDGVAQTDAVDGDAASWDPVNDEIFVALPTVPINGSVTVTFDVILDRPDDGATSWTVSNQAIVTTPTSTISSDDPSTSPDDDPTDIDVYQPVIPVTGPVGTLILIGLIAFAGLGFLRRRL